MNAKAVSSRRLFFWKAGAAVSAPLAAATAHGLGDSRSIEAIEARLAELEDLNAIRALQQTFVRLVDTRAHRDAARLFADAAVFGIDENIAGLAPDDASPQNGIELAPNGDSAISRLHCTVETEMAIGPDCTLVDMARQQGEGFVHGSEYRMLVIEYEKRHGVWKIRRSTLDPR